MPHGTFVSTTSVSPGALLREMEGVAEPTRDPAQQGLVWSLSRSGDRGGLEREGSAIAVNGTLEAVRWSGQIPTGECAVVVIGLEASDILVVHDPSVVIRVESLGMLRLSPKVNRRQTASAPVDLDVRVVWLRPSAIHFQLQHLPHSLLSVRLSSPPPDFVNVALSLVPIVLDATINVESQLSTLRILPKGRDVAYLLRNGVSMGKEERASTAESLQWLASWAEMPGHSLHRLQLEVTLTPPEGATVDIDALSVELQLADGAHIACFHVLPTVTVGDGPTPRLALDVSAVGESAIVWQCTALHALQSSLDQSRSSSTSTRISAPLTLGMYGVVVAEHVPTAHEDRSRLVATLSPARATVDSGRAAANESSSLASLAIVACAKIHYDLLVDGGSGPFAISPETAHEWAEGDGTAMRALAHVTPVDAPRLTLHGSGVRRIWRSIRKESEPVAHWNTTPQ